MPSEEGKQVLKLLAEGKIDAEQAYRLLAAIGDVPGEGEPGEAARERVKGKFKEKFRGFEFAFGGPEAPGAPPGPPWPGPWRSRGRLLRIRITEGGKQKVNVMVPLGLARLGRIGGIADHIAKRFDIDLREILRTVESTVGGKIVDLVDDEGDRVEIFVE